MKTVMLVSVCLLLCGCNQMDGVQQDLVEASQVRAIVAQTMAELDANKADPNKTDEQKILVAADIISKKAVEVGLVPPEQAVGFWDAVKMAYNAYLAVKPMGTAKIDWTQFFILAFVIFRKRK